MQPHNLVDRLLLDAIIVLAAVLAVLGGVWLLGRYLAKTDRR